MGRVPCVYGHAAGPARRVRVVGFLGRGRGWPGGSQGQCGEFPESGEDLGEQVMTRRRVQDWLSCLENAGPSRGWPS